MDGYWQKVLVAAWDKTWRVMGWSHQKAATLAVTALAVLAAGGFAALLNLISGSFALIFGALTVATAFFMYGVIETQAALYSQLNTSTKLTITNLEAEIERQREPKPNFDKWRHRERLSLRTAAQLWSNVRPQMGLFGEARETYEMLRGAIQKGELEFEPPQPLDPYMRDVRPGMLRENPSADLIVTRQSLRAFAKRYGYDPPFLQNADCAALGPGADKG